MTTENIPATSDYVTIVAEAFPSDTSGRTYWVGPIIKALRHNEIFVFGANPEFANGAGGAAAAMRFGAYYGSGRGIVGKTYGIVTKNLDPEFYEASTGIRYPEAGLKSVSPEQIRANIAELYTVARRYAELNFLITFQLDIDAFGNDHMSLNGYLSKDMAAFFLAGHEGGIPANVIFHHSYAEIIQDLKLEASCLPQATAPDAYVVKDPKIFDLDFHKAASRQARAASNRAQPDNQRSLF